MELHLKSIRKSLNKAYLRETVTRSDFDQSIKQLEKLLTKNKDTPFNNFIIPTINLTNIIEEDVVLDMDP